MSAAFLLDADNLSSASDVDQVFRHFHALGVQVTVRRAYGGHEKLNGIKEVLRQHAVRSFVNQGRGTTDASLVVDAMDLLHHGALPGVVAIGSSDADFAPLAVRLREAGIRLLCFALRDKADPEALALVYDEVIYLGTTHRSEAPGALAKTASRKSAARPPVARPAAAPKAAVAPKPAARPKPLADRKPARPPATDAFAERDAILQAAPDLLGGEPLPLNEVTKQLRDAQVLGRNARSTTLLRRHPDDFRLTPERNPAHVQWTKRGGR